MIEISNIYYFVDLMQIQKNTAIHINSLEVIDYRFDLLNEIGPSCSLLIIKLVHRTFKLIPDVFVCVPAGLPPKEGSMLGFLEQN